MAKPARYNITAKTNSTFKLDFTLKLPNGSLWNLTGYTAALQVRATPEASTAVLSLSNGNGITLGGALGTVSVEVLDLQVAPGKYVYDIELVSAGGEQWPVMEGKFKVDSNVVR